MTPTGDPIPIEIADVEVREHEPGKGVCDFCSSPHIRWRYPCQTWTREELSPKGLIDHGYLGDWSACQPCHDLIERDDRDALAQRAIESEAMALQIPAATRLDESQMQRLHGRVRQLQDEFFAHRQGPPRPASQSSVDFRARIRFADSNRHLSDGGA